MRSLFTVLAFAGAIGSAGAQSAKDSSTARVVKVARDSVNCTSTAAARQRRACRRLDSLRTALLTPPPVVVPPPVVTPPPVIGDSMPSPVYAQLPRDSVVVDPAPTVSTKQIAAGTALGPVMAAAVAGDVICLASGSYGPVTFPKRADSGWVTVRPCAPDSTWAVPGSRIRPSTAGALPVLRGGDRTIAFANGARGWRLVGLNVECSGSASVIQVYSCVEIGGLTPIVAADIPNDIVLDRLYIHATPSTIISRCVALNSARTAIVYSWLDECHQKGPDSQAILGGGGPGPYLIAWNTLIGAGENVMFGGFDPKLPTMQPQDITIRGNHFYTPASWKGLWTKKNLFEMKYGQRVLVERNVFDGSWLDGQDGYGIVLKSSNQSRTCAWCRTSDVTFRRNVVRNVGQGFHIVGEDRSNGKVDSLMRRIDILENWVDSVNVAPYNGQGAVRQLFFVANAQSVAFNRNVFASGGVIGASTYFEPPDPVNVAQISGNVFLRSTYGVIGCQSAPPWSCASGLLWGTNAVLGANGSQTLPPGAVVVTSPTMGVTWALVQSAVSGVVVAR